MTAISKNESIYYMIESMTGFGRATVSNRTCAWTVEIRSVNHRFLDLSVRLPSAFSGWEADIQKMIQTQLKRGKITVGTTFTTEQETQHDKIVFDEEKLNFYLKTFRKVSKKHGLRDDLGMREVITLPNIFLVEKPDASSHYWDVLKKAIDQSIKKLLAMRAHEGQAIARDLTARVKRIKSSIGKISKLAENMPVIYKELLTKRIQELAKDIAVEPDRIAREVAFQVDRSDISEEITRAKHHIESLIQALDSNQETGKKLDFILQELNREANTIGSKAQNVQISDEVIRIKSELEKIREQVQNIL